MIDTRIGDVGVNCYTLEDYTAVLTFCHNDGQLWRGGRELLPAHYWDEDGKTIYIKFHGSNGISHGYPKNEGDEYYETTDFVTFTEFLELIGFEQEEPLRYLG